MTNPCAGHFDDGQAHGVLFHFFSVSFCCNLVHGHLRQVVEEHLDWVGYQLQT